MPIYAYTLSHDSSEFETGINNQIPDTVTNVVSIFSSVMFVEVAATSKEDLDEYLGSFGFKPVSGTQTNIPGECKMWGTFSTANAPTTGVSNGDIGYCTDGDEGDPCLTAYSDGNWKVVDVGDTIDDSN